MKNLFRLTTALLFATCQALPAGAQEMKKKEPPAPLPSPTEALVGAWNYENGKVLKMAEDFAEAQYDMKPHPSQRSFAEQLLHVAGANAFVASLLTGKPGAQESDFARDKYKTKAEVVAVLKKSIDDGAAAIRAKGDAGLAVPFVSPWGNYLTRPSDFTMGMVAHTGEHYGQLVVYYRVAGLVPPESRPR
jgi:uncharacterized damage-inducible protein DinB